MQANIVASSNLHDLSQEASAIEGVNLKLIVAFLWAINEDVFANGVSLGLCIAAFNATDAVHVIRAPRHVGVLSPIVHTIPVQLLSYHAALARGTDVDKPRNLAKSVTVE